MHSLHDFYVVCCFFFLLMCFRNNHAVRWLNDFYAFWWSTTKRFRWYGELNFLHVLHVDRLILRNILNLCLWICSAMQFLTKFLFFPFFFLLVTFFLFQICWFTSSVWCICVLKFVCRQNSNMVFVEHEFHF